VTASAMESDIRTYKNMEIGNYVSANLESVYLVYFVTPPTGAKLNNVDKLNRKNAKNVDILSR
jgi:hypothetical protein